MSNFLAAQYPSHLVPSPSDPDAALKRARIDLFVDAFITKFQMPLFKLFTATGDDEIKAVVDGAVASLVREVEPRLGNAAPFFGGQEKLGLAEVCLSRVLCLVFWVCADWRDRS